MDMDSEALTSYFRVETIGHADGRDDITAPTDCGHATCRERRTVLGVRVVGRRSRCSVEGQARVNGPTAMLASSRILTWMPKQPGPGGHGDPRSSGP